MTRPAVLVTVQGRGRAVDVALVADAPVGALAAAVAAELGEEAGSALSLGPPAGPAWPPTRTLDELGVRDGDVLRLFGGADGLSRATP